MKNLLNDIRLVLSNYVVIFWILSLLFIISFITTMLALAVKPVEGSRLMQQSISSVIITFSGIIFLRNWIKAYKKNEEISRKKDYGLAWLAGAMLCWSLFISLDLLLSGQVKYLGPVFSALNSFCFLFAIPYFDCIKEGKRVPRILLQLGINSDRYKTLVSAYVLAVLFIIIIISRLVNQPLSLQHGHINFLWSGIVDAVCLGFPTLGILFLTFYQTWLSPVRKDKWMVALTIIVLSFTLVMQFVNALDTAGQYTVEYAISSVLYRVLLIMLFYGIAFSWTYSMLVNQNDEFNKAQIDLLQRNEELREKDLRLVEQNKELEKRGMEIEFAHKNMKHGILNNVLILKMDLYNMLDALKNVQGHEASVKEVTAIFNRYDFLLQMAGLLYNPAEEYTDKEFFTRLMQLVKKVLHLQDDEFRYSIEIDGSVTKSVSQQRDFGIITYELITNAKKYGSGQKVDIEAEIIKENDHVIVKVKDRGPNFFDVHSADHSGKLRGLKSVLGRIKFYQGNYHTCENFPGTVFVASLPV